MLQIVAAQLDDTPFLYALYASTRRDEVAAWGWDAAQQEPFLQMQFQLQQRAYAQQYPEADHRFIIYSGQQAGRMLLHRSSHELLLIDIALLPAFRNRGIGATLLRALQDEAASAERPLCLRVLKENPARRLYERLGFAITADLGLHYAMEWRPAAAAGAAPQANSTRGEDDAAPIADRIR